jgi:hypothetical protein
LKKMLALAGAGVLALSLTSCTGHTSTSSDQQRSAQALNALDKSQPVPVFNYSQIRQTLIDAETAQSNTTQTTSFFFVMGVQNPVFSCPSIGYPVPETDQITNPEQVKWDEPNDNTPYTLPQIDPNGIYGGNTNATFVICVGPNGDKFLEHAEEDVHTVSGPAVWDSATHQIKITGTSTVKVHTSGK